MKTKKEELKKIRSLRTISSPQRIAGNFLKYNLRRASAKPPRPNAMCIYVTYMCQMRCQMCEIWKMDDKKAHDTELSLSEWGSILADPLFTRLEFINVNGGEPNLRQDLPKMVELFAEKFPRLRTITMNSNGLPVQRASANVAEISRICRDRDIRFSVSISLHALGSVFDEIVGVPNAYPKVLETLRALKKMQESLPFYLGVNCVITDTNIDHLHDMLQWSREENIPVNFTLGEVRDRFHNLDTNVMSAIRTHKKKDLLKFLRSLAKNKSLFNQHAYRYRQLADMIELDKKRRISCHYAMGGVILGSEGTLYYCKDSRPIGNCRERSAEALYFDPENLSYRKKELIEKKCRTCPPNTFNRIELEKDLLKYIGFLLTK
ncbi:MAG: hypothetical protein JXB23_14725 [Candidatus Aminicenantes bacterium]|nr:hypothetical protein [Candidatus Aminicenantes bacterium]